MRFLFRAHGSGLVLVRIVEPGFLVNRAARLQDGDLAPRLMVDGHLDETHGVHVLDLAARAQMFKILGLLVFLVLPGAADRHIHVGAQVPVLHVAVAGAEIEHDLAQLGQVGGGLFGATDIGARDDLHQRNPGAVEVHEGQGRVHVMDRLPRVLFQVDALDADRARRAVPHLHQHFALTHDGVIKLRDFDSPVAGRGRNNSCGQRRSSGGSRPSAPAPCARPAPRRPH